MADDLEKGWHAAILRNKFYASYSGWFRDGLVELDNKGMEATGDSLRIHLSRLLGYQHFHAMLAADPDEYEASILAMTGVHGFAIYRMLLVRRGMV